MSTVSGTSRPVKTKTISGKCRVIDGDTIHIGKVRIRLAGIDAPELEHFWGQKAKWELVALCKGKKVTARLEPDLSYDRVVATCFLPDGRDLSAEMVKMGLALDWAKFSGGKYAPYEPEGVRKKLSRAAARQKGQMHIFNAPMTVKHKSPSSGAKTSKAVIEVACPKCGQSMVERKNGKSGQRYLGCSTFPKCRGSRVLS